MKKSKALILAALFCVVALGGCGRMRYAHIVTKMRRMHSLPEEGGHFPLRVISRKDSQPVADAQVTVRSKCDPIQLTSDSRGFIRMPFTTALEEENPAVVTEAESPTWLCGLPGYRRFVATFGKKPSEANLRERAWIRVIKNDGTPLPGVGVEILSESATIKFSTDDDGLFEIPVRADLFKENPGVFADLDSYPQQLDCREIIMGHVYRYMEVIDHYEQCGIVSDESEFVSLRAFECKTGKPAEGVTLEFLPAAGVANPATDETGVLRLPVCDELKSANPLVSGITPAGVGLRHMPSHIGMYANRYTYNALARDRVVKVKADGMSRIDGDGFVVWYEDAAANEAQTAKGILEEQYSLIRRVTGLEPVKWGIILFEDLPPTATYVCKRSSSGRISWCYGRQDVLGGLFADANAHEWAELTLAQQLYDGNPDRSSRFVLDGLAEYVSFLHTGVYTCQLEYLEAVRDAGRSEMNLLKDFRYRLIFPVLDIRLVAFASNPPEGYYLSFVFWYDLCREHGEDFPRSFVEKMSAEKRRNATTAVAILEEMTGTTDVRDRLTRANMDEAIKVIEELKPARETHVRELQAGAALR